MGEEEWQLSAGLEPGGPVLGSVPTRVDSVTCLCLGGPATVWDGGSPQAQGCHPHWGAGYSCYNGRFRFNFRCFPAIGRRKPEVRRCFPARGWGLLLPCNAGNSELGRHLGCVFVWYMYILDHTQNGWIRLSLKLQCIIPFKSLFILKAKNESRKYWLLPLVTWVMLSFVLLRKPSSHTRAGQEGRSKWPSFPPSPKMAVIPACVGADFPGHRLQNSPRGSHSQSLRTRRLCSVLTCWKALPSFLHKLIPSFRRQTRRRKRIFRFTWTRA